jgi:hypothetical protein
VDEQHDEPSAREPKVKPRGPKPPGGQSGGAVYGLGLIGALVWYWRQADEPADRVRAVLKALVWPAFLVYRAFAVLHLLATDNETTSQ